jgi:bloom syndrome protein
MFQLEFSLESRASTSESHTKWEQEVYPWSSKMKQLLNDTFHIHSFRPLQLSTINAILSGEDVLLIMSTGINHQVRATVFLLCVFPRWRQVALLSIAVIVGSSGVTLVITPLVSLMHDQIAHLNKLNINAAMLTAITETYEVRVCVCVCVCIYCR